MESEWAKTRLGDVAAINPDAIGRDWPYQHIRYIDISSVGVGKIDSLPQIMSLSDSPSRAKRLVKKGDTVLSTVRPNRRSMFFVSDLGDDWVVSTGFAVLRPNTQFVNPRFLYLCVFDQAFTEYLVTREKGAAYPAVSPEDIAKAEIPLPPLKEQEAIAHILGTLDDKIELNRRLSETLEAMARALFKSWFVDFEPVRAKLAHPSPAGRGVRGEGALSQKPPLPEHLLQFARELRKNATDAENLLWRLLRNRQLAGAKFRRQHPFPPYVLDFYCHEHKLAVEVDGGQHNEADRRLYDTQRSEVLAQHGIRLLRFWNHEVLNETEAVLQVIFDALDDPHPGPLPKGEGGWPQHILDLFPDRLVPSELGEIPEGWEAATLGRIVSQRSERVDRREVTVLSAVASGRLVRSDDHFTKRVYSNKTEKYLLVEQWDFAYNPSRINIGSIGMLEENIVGGVSPVYVVARPATPYQWFLEFSMQRAHTKTWINTLASGSVRQSLSFTDFASIPCVVPPKAVVQEFNRRWSTLREGIRSREAESEALAALRDALLPKLIRGEIRVRDAERFLKERGL